MALRAAIAAAVAATATAQQSKSGSGDGYAWWCEGVTCDAFDDAATPSPGLVLMGGSTDVDAAFEYQISRAGGGDFLVLRATGSDAYNPYVWELAAGRLHSVWTIILTSDAAATAPFVLDAVNASDAIFFAGGDQTLYVERIVPSSPLAGALLARAAHVTVGGTSAGADYLSDIVFAPPTDAPSVTSPDALADPFEYGMAFANSSFFFPAFGTGGARRVVADTHFEQRDRMGRGLAFLARVAADGDVPVGGGAGCAYLVAVNERTALLVEPDGAAALVGATSAFVCALCDAPAVVRKGSPVTAGPFACSRVDVGDAYDFKAWRRVAGGVDYELSVDRGAVVGDAYGPAAARAPAAPAADAARAR